MEPNGIEWNGARNKPNIPFHWIHNKLDRMKIEELDGMDSAPSIIYKSK